jgi:hypothetical protein
VARARGVGAGHDGDRVFTAIVDVNERDAGSGVDRHDAVEAHTCGRKVGQRDGSKRIAPDRAVQRNVRAGPARGQRLIRTLAAGQRGERRSGNRFARRRHARHPRDQVKIDGTENDDHAFRASADPGGEP